MCESSQEGLILERTNCTSRRRAACLYEDDKERGVRAVRIRCGRYSAKRTRTL